MKNKIRICKPLIAILIFTLFYSASLFAMEGDNYFDYIPKYRKLKSNYQIDKIEYRNKRTIIYFRFVAQEDQGLSFHNGMHPASWYLRTPPRMRGIEVQFRLLEIRNIRINDDLRKKSLSSAPEVDYEISKGDVVTCQMHFVRIPHYIRMLDLIHGEDGDLDPARLNCFDILVKTKESPLLGSPESVKKLTDRFEASFPYVKPKVPQSSLNDPDDFDETITDNDEKPTPKIIDEGTADPIDYRPTAMRTLDDLDCDKRVILPSVKFKEDDVRFNGRVRAMQDIKVLYKYLKFYPDARVRLHGHTDVHGSNIRNLELSRERTMTVKLELVRMGIKRDRIEILFYGGKQPLQGMEKGSAENRRVEVEAICTE